MLLREPRRRLGRAQRAPPERPKLPEPAARPARPVSPRATAAPSLLQLIDEGTFGMGPAGRRARSVSRWDQGTRASLDQAAQAAQAARCVRAKSLRPVSDPWAAYFDKVPGTASQVPVWGVLPRRRQHKPMPQAGAISQSWPWPVTRATLRPHPCLAGRIFGPTA